MKDVPVEEFEKLPTDASQIDHYLYGHRKTMNTVFAATFYWLALTNTHDALHERA